MTTSVTLPRFTCVHAAAILAALVSTGDQAAAAELAPVEATASLSADASSNSVAGAPSAQDLRAHDLSAHDMSVETHGAVPAGVFGAYMVDAGSVMLRYTPIIMGMDKNYIGSSTVSQQYIATQIPFVPVAPTTMRPPTLRIVPASMSSDMNMFHLMFGITDTFNLMLMGDYISKSMTMTTFQGMKGSTVLGNSSSSTEGWGDTSFVGLVRLYQDDIHHLHLNLGVSVPSGSVTEQATMLSPMGVPMTMRANYAMQLGTGTYDGLYGVSYTGKLGPWSWGLVYRGRAAFGDNSEGYRWDPSNELTGWGGYELFKGLSLTARAAASEWGPIHGYDALISGPMEAADPNNYGGKRVELFGGLEYKIHGAGLTPVRLAVEGGAPVYQYLNGPQMGKAWQVNLALAIGF